MGAQLAIKVVQASRSRHVGVRAVSPLYSRALIVRSRTSIRKRIISGDLNTDSRVNNVPFPQFKIENARGNGHFVAARNCYR